MKMYLVCFTFTYVLRVDAIAKTWRLTVTWADALCNRGDLERLLHALLDVRPGISYNSLACTTSC